MQRPDDNEKLATTGFALGGVGMAGLAAAAGACCAPGVAPLVVAALGASGAAWAAGFGPWAHWILAASGALVGVAHWRLHRGRGARAGQACSVRAPRLLTTLVWIAALVWLAALATQVWGATMGTTP